MLEEEAPIIWVGIKR